MASHPEVNATALGSPVHDPTPHQVRRAGITTVSYCLANQLPHAEMVELLQAVGAVPTPSSAPRAKYASPEAEERRRSRRAATRKAKRKAAS